MIEKIKNYFKNISIEKGIPRFIFIVLYLCLLIGGIIFIHSIETRNRNLYVDFFINKISSVDFKIEENRNQAFEAYYEMFNLEIPESEHIKNLAFIIWSSQGDLLWHSNKLVEKVVGKNSTQNRELLRDFSFLDIPEKNFKPYDSFKTNQGKIVSNNFAVEFERNIVHHFYKVSDKKNDYYVEILREFHNMIPRSVFIYLFSGILLISGLFAYLAYLFLRIFLGPLNQMHSSMEVFIKNKNVELVYDYSENEVGKLIKTYNMFLSKLSTYSENNFADIDGKNQKVIDYLQEMLVKKSIRKSDQMELLLYPRHPKNDFRMFVTIEEHDQVTYILYVHFDINNIESNLEKHIIQDRFKELSLKTAGMAEISDELFKDMVTHADLGPGFLLIRLSGKEMEWVRCGPFFIYLLDEAGEESKYLEAGVEYLPTELLPVEKIKMEGKCLLVVSESLLDVLNMDRSEFNYQIVDTSDKTGLMGKQLLTSILEDINRVNPEALNQSPMISLVRLK